MRVVAMGFVALFLLFLCNGVPAEFLIGVGKADVTGPAAQTVAMGYAHTSQILNGIHTRLWARAFLFGHPTDTRKRVVYVSLEACAASQAVTMRVIQRLKEEFGDLYTEANVAINPTHTHAAPGGYLQYFLYSMATVGFVRETFDAHVSGIVKSIRMAHETAKVGRVHLRNGELLDTSINRSPDAYANNTAEERSGYAHDTDKTMTLLKLTTTEDMEVGMLNWFAVHGTALNNTVRLISGDNKGAAAQLFEKHVWRQRNVDTFFNRSSSSFVAAFAQSNSGDVSPNTGGTFCIDTGLPCTANNSSCNGHVERCHGRGPGWPDTFRSNFLIAEKQFTKARELYEEAQDSEELHGDVDYRSIFFNMSSWTAQPDGGASACRPAMGYSFAAGTTDGPGMFGFVQGQTSASFFWDMVSAVLYRRTEEQATCHRPKPILLDTGEIPEPMPWQPEIVQLQILRIGQLAVVCVPGEVTTMAGRRLRSAIYSKVKDRWGAGVQIVISGLTNEYSSYIATNEEYHVQFYEGASTIFGPHTLEAYITVTSLSYALLECLATIQEFEKLAEDMVNGIHRESEVQPPDYLDRQWSFSLPVELDHAPFSEDIGDVSSDRLKDCYAAGETVEVEFWSANPRNSLSTKGHTFLTVERFDSASESWVVVATDDDLSTRFSWRPCMGMRILPCSKSLLSWTVEAGTAEGLYRIGHFGHAKLRLVSLDVSEFYGYSTTFQIQHVCTQPSARRVIV